MCACAPRNLQHIVFYSNDMTRTRRILRKSTHFGQPKNFHNGGESCFWWWYNTFSVSRNRGFSGEKIENLGEPGIKVRTGLCMQQKAGALNIRLRYIQVVVYLGKPSHTEVT